MHGGGVSSLGRGVGWDVWGEGLGQWEVGGSV